MKTWMAELAFVWLVLIGVVAATRGGPLEAVGALAVLAAFAHSQVAERMREKEALKSKPDVHCHRWSLRYFFAKELLWLAYFVAHRSWSALVGVGVFLLYPLWRKWWRARHPLQTPRERVLFGKPSLVFINGCSLELLPASDIFADKPWSAGLVLRLDRSGCELIAGISRARADMHVGFRMGSELWTGHAKPHRLQFWDDPNQRDVRLASFSMLGIGELSRV